MGTMSGSRSQPEASFHDRWARETPLEDIRVPQSFEHIAAQENRFILELMGDVAGRRILDVGAGLGESSVYFALRGAQVTASDISPVMLERCVALAQRYDVTISTLEGAAEECSFGEGRYDIVYGANVLHHIADLEAVLRKLRQALVPDGRFFFYDPLHYNPAIRVYRRLATGVRSEGERPLTFSQLEIFERVFSDVHHREFWLTALLLFLKYFFVDRVHPNADRYWKRILREDEEALRRWFEPLLRLDRVLLRVPPLHYMAWNMVTWGRK
jgi:2-polyprenyl-3-methyl-5-hydroxy-6-metoxy-1,4-benzoquinol methylase